MANKQFRVLLTEPIHEAGVSLLQERGYELRMGTGIAEHTLLKEIKDCDAVLTRNGRMTERVMRVSDRLQVVSMHGVGVDLIDVAAATRLNIQVVNAPDSNKVSVAEYTIGLMLDLAKRIPLYDHSLRAGNWGARHTLGVDLEGKTLGIVGMGGIGRLVAEKAVHGFHMRVVAYKRNLNGAVPMDNVEYTDDLNKVIAGADFLSLHVPANKDTTGMIGARELALMKPAAYLINTARGEIIDQRALCEALLNRRIAGAAVDVFAGGVPDMDDPLLKLDNVIVTPHAAASTEQSARKMALHSALGVDEVLSGCAPSWPVNRLSRETRLCV